MVERSDRMWSTGERNGEPLQYSCLRNPMNSMKSKMMGCGSAVVQDPTILNSGLDLEVEREEDRLDQSDWQSL